MFGFFPKVNAKNRVAQFSSASVRTVPNAETEEGNKSKNEFLMTHSSSDRD